MLRELIRNAGYPVKRCTDEVLFEPWSAPEEILRGIGVKLGQHYPKPIVNLKASREQALAAFSALS